MAVTTSRAFRVRGPDKPAAQLPLIDMCNHSFAPNCQACLSLLQEHVREMLCSSAQQAHARSIACMVFVTGVCGPIRRQSSLHMS